MFSKKTMCSFAAKYEVNPESGCWEWTASFARGGYGQFSTSTQDGCKWYRAHRFAHEAFIGPVPEGYVVMHKCDNPKCVNPDHLTSGTHADNIKDRDKKGRGIWNRILDHSIEEITSSPLSDGDMARKLGCSRNHVWKVRNGKYAWVRALRGASGGRKM
jgi:hypothetical protein